MRHAFVGKRAMITMTLTSSNKVIISCRMHQASAWQHKHLIILCVSTYNKVIISCSCVLQLVMTLFYVKTHNMDNCLCCQADVQCILQLKMTLLYVETHNMDKCQCCQAEVQCVLQLMMALLYVETHNMNKCLCCQADLQCVLQLMMTLLLTSSCHWKTFSPFSWPKKRPEKSICNTNIELLQNRTEKQIIPFKAIVNWLFNNL